MLLYPNAKINIGLKVVAKRDDGYHDIETIFYPLQLSDKLSIEKSIESFSFYQNGITLDCDLESNLIVKTYRLFQKKYDIGNVRIQFFKQIPFGAGLGGGSSDAAHTAIALNELFHLQLSKEQLIEDVKLIGADCPFFILNQPCLATGIGDQLKPISLVLSNLKIVLVKPDVSVNTKTAYKGICPKMPDTSLSRLISLPVEQWKDKVINDFESTVFTAFPKIAEIKNELYDLGAIYASMSGSGASVYALFKNDKTFDENAIKNKFIDSFVYVQTC